MLKFSANLSTLYDEFPFMERFRQAKSFGFENYQMKFPYDVEPTEIKSAADGMNCVLMNAYKGDTDDSFGCGASPGQQDKFFHCINKINPYYFHLLVQKVNILTGLRDPDVPIDYQVNTLVENLKGLDDYLDTYNMTALLEPICSNEIENYFLNSFDLAVHVIKSVNMPNVKLLLDIYHLHQITGDVKKSLVKYYPYAGHIKISKFEPYADDCPIDYHHVFDFLRQKQHGDPIGLEYFRSEGKFTEQCLNWIRKV